MQEAEANYSIVFTIGGLVHIFGITFYGIYASGELQSWAEPVVQECPVWSPTKGQGVTETAFVSYMKFIHDLKTRIGFQLKKRISFFIFLPRMMQIKQHNLI